MAGYVLRWRSALLKWFDIPPVWLGIALGICWGFDWLFPGLGVGLGWMRWLGAGLVWLGLLAMAAGLFELMRHRTTFVPRRMPTGFAQSGIYRITRNPIYLGDALVLAGAVLWWDVWPALLLIPAFVMFITHRFISGEEAGLRAAFGDEFDIWAGQVRRWL